MDSTIEKYYIDNFFPNADELYKLLKDIIYFGKEFELGLNLS